MSQKREIKQAVLRCNQLEQDQFNLDQNRYNHEHHVISQNENVCPSQSSNQNEFIDQTTASQTNTLNQISNEMNYFNLENRSEQNKSSNSKCDNIPKEIYEIFKFNKDLKKQSVKTILKKWNSQCKEYENSIKNSIKQYHKRQEVERRSLNFQEIKNQYYHQSKVKQNPSECDIAYFISSLNCYESNKAQLRIILNDQEIQTNQQMQMIDEKQISITQLISFTLKNQIFQSLQELSFQLISEQLHNQSFFDCFCKSLDFQNLKYLQLSFANEKCQFTIAGQSFVSLSYRLKNFCPKICYLVLEFQEIDISPNDFSIFSDNILHLQNLIFIDLRIINTPKITTNDVIKLLKGLTKSEKTHIELFFRDAQQINLNQELFEIISTILDLPQMYYLKSLCLNFPVIFPPGNDTYQKQIMIKMSELFNKTPFLNNFSLFIELHQKIQRLICLKSFNYQKIWAQLLKMRKIGLLNKFRKEIAWDLSEFQEKFVF